MRERRMRYLISCFVASTVATGFGSGCAFRWPHPVMQVKLTYEIPEREKSTIDLSAVRIHVVPFQDHRTNEYLYDHNDHMDPFMRERRRVMLEEGESAGTWIARALALELELAGAQVEVNPTGTSSTTGYELSGEVTHLSAKPSGVDVGLWPIALATGMGFKGHIKLKLQLRDGSSSTLARDYEMVKNIPSDAAYVIFLGRPQAYDGRHGVPKAFSKLLKQVIREQILPDLVQACKKTSSQTAAVDPLPGIPREGSVP